MAVSLLLLSPFPQQPNLVLCHIILWLTDVLHFSTNRNGGVTYFFFFFLGEAHLYSFFLHQTCTTHDDTIQEKAWQKLFSRSPVLLGLSTQFKNWYMVWSLHLQHKLKLETHWGCVLLLHHLESVTWFGSAGASVNPWGLTIHITLVFSEKCPGTSQNNAIVWLQNTPYSLNRVTWAKTHYISLCPYLVCAYKIVKKKCLKPISILLERGSLIDYCRL